MYRVSVILMGAFVPVLAILGYFAFDFYNVNRMSRGGDGDGVSVGEYISAIVPIAGVLASEPAAPEMPTELVDMLPKAPEGWTMRSTEPGDIDSYLPADADQKLVKYVRAVVNPRGGNGTKEVRMTYVNGPRIVVFELVRYPNFIFTSFGATPIKMELQMTSTRYRGRSFMTVRGMEFAEDQLPEEVGLRYFMGDVADQMWVRVLAPRGMTDQELLPFFQTLHVPAMNAGVIEKISGMGEVPVIVIASVLDEDLRAARDAERATEETTREQERAQRKAERAAEEAAAAAEAEAAAAARKQAEEDRAAGIERDENTGVILRKGTGESSKKAEKPKAGFGSDGCKVEGGRKVCGTGD